MTVSRRNVLGMLAGASLLPQLTFAAEEESLNTLAKRKGMRFGNAIANAPNRFGDPAYRALMARECGVLVCENETKWQALEPAHGKLNFQPADEMFGWARSQGMLIRGHTLVWQPEKWLPKWVNEYNFGTKPKVEAERLLREHITTVCRHFGKEIYSYDVVNEAIDPATGDYRSNVFTRQLGAVEQLDLAFHTAQAEAPHAQLVYNDYMRWDKGSAKHRAGVLKLLHALKKKGSPVQALGLQSHIGSWDEFGTEKNALLEWRKFLDEVSGMGLDLLITEFDVNDRELPGDIAKRDAGVAAMAREYLDLTLSYPNLRDFLTWGMADNVSWLQEWDEAPRKDKLPMRPAPYDDKLQPKPLRTALAESFKAMPMRRA